MPEPRPEVLDFLATRRSRPAKTLGNEAPGREELMRLLTIATRVPDHGKLIPWRFVVIEGAAQDRLVAAATDRLRAMGREADIGKCAGQFRQGGVIVAVVASPKPSVKIPGWEQQMSAGCACFALLSAALAAGWGANWLTGPLARDADFLGNLGLLSHESVAGFIHIGNQTVAPSERDRPDVEAITAWA